MKEIKTNKMDWTVQETEVNKKKQDDQNQGEPLNRIVLLQEGMARHGKETQLVL